MNHFSILAVLTFSILTTITWVLRKVYLSKQDLVPLILLETLFVSTSIIAISFYLLGPQKFMNTPSILDTSLFLYMSLFGILIAISIFAMGYLVKYEEVSKLSPMIGGTKTVMIAIVGFLLFGEQITPRKIISIGLIVSGLFMLLNHTH